jgi:hypothetical protein
VIGLFAEGTFGQTGTGFAGGDELAGKLDEVGGDVDGRGDFLEGGRLPEDNLFLEGEDFVFIERNLDLILIQATGGGRRGIAASYLICVVEPDGETGVGRWVRKRFDDSWLRGARVNWIRGVCGDGRCEGPLIEFGEELILCVGHGLSVESGDLGCGFCGANGVLGLLGEEGAVALGVGVSLGDGGGDAGGASVSRRGRNDGSNGVALMLVTAGAMSGETLGHLFL